MTRNAIDERRRYPRMALPLAYAGVTIKSGDIVIDGHAFDVSMSGVRVEVDESISPGSEATIELNLPGQMREVKAMGSVVWGYFDPEDPRTNRLALEFDAFDSDLDREALRSYLAHGRPMAA